ncbi:hypothetical protein SMC26_09415 [Actinomadura fulvescens]|uniref:Secreted protein n=1 Tax=Actinomadura fulvescens TaxID=46160 RepID=A0ABP6CHI5_9ACTN
MRSLTFLTFTLPVVAVVCLAGTTQAVTSEGDPPPPATAGDGTCDDVRSVLLEQLAAFRPVVSEGGEQTRW